MGHVFSQVESILYFGVEDDAFLGTAVQAP